ncbi:MAG: hypothetical protein AB7N54_05690 [Alphaproteobacteria bacterium]
MIRFRRLVDAATERDRAQLDAVRTMFATAFPAERRAIDRLLAGLGEREVAYETVVLIAEDERGRVLGLSVTMYFRALRFGYLVYIASDPQRPARGIGGALYEALREYLIRKGAAGLFLDAGPDDPEKLDDPQRAPLNRRRMTFYERYGARPIEGTLYDVVGNPANDGFRVTLLFDPLDRRTPLRRAEARAFLRRMYLAQYGQGPTDPYVRQIVSSFRDDPVRIRPPRARAPRAVPSRSWLRPLKLVVAENHRIHHLREKGYVERPVRIDAVLRGLAEVPHERVPTRRFKDDILREIHDPDLVSYLQAMSERLSASALLYPEVFPVRRPDRRPRELESRAGYFCIDTFTPLTHNVWRAARAAVDTALTGAELVLEGNRLVYALTRPPGHHAERGVYGGFCYLNNAAAAAHRLSRHGRVSVLDIDYHHGNGTQDIFWRRGDVQTLSIHGSPSLAYPHFAGWDDERGEGDGRGTNRNFPLRRGVDDARYLEVLEEALTAIRRFRPSFLVIALGFDIMRGDPTGSFVVTTRGLRAIGVRLGRMGLPTLLVQEGGYSPRNLRVGAEALFEGLGSTWY